MGERPIRVFYSPLSGRFYDSQRYRVEPSGVVVITGKKYDVTDDIGAAVTKHALEFTPAASPMQEEVEEP